jgi:6-phosphofructokinase 1
MTSPKRIGILTGGGDSPGLNAVIRAVAKSLILDAGAEVIGIADGFAGMVERRVRPLGLRDVSGILALGGTVLGTSNKANPFAWHDRGGADVSAEAIRYARDELKLDAVVAIGGDGSMSIAHRLHLGGLPMVGVPKTIDNDLVHTDRTFGFDTGRGDRDRGHGPAAHHRGEPPSRDDPGDHGPPCRLDRAVCRCRGRCGRDPGAGDRLRRRRGRAGVPRA